MGAAGVPASIPFRNDGSCEGPVGKGTAYGVYPEDQFHWHAFGKSAAHLSTMNLIPINVDSSRPDLFLTQTQEAIKQERTQRVRMADEEASLFVRDTVGPMLRNAERILMAAGIPAVATGRTDSKSTAASLTVNFRGDNTLSLLTFESRRGSTTPQATWTYGGLLHKLSDLNPAAASGIVEEFLKYALLARA